MLAVLALGGAAGCSESPTATREGASTTYTKYSASALAGFTVALSGPTSAYPSTQGTCTGSGSARTCYTYVAYTATTSGGTAPYTYAWQVVYADGHTFNRPSYTSSSATERYQFTIYNFDRPGIQVRVTVSSANGSQASSSLSTSVQ